MNEKIYIMAPYSKGNRTVNVRRAIDVANIVFNNGDIPFIPHLAHFWQLIYPRSEEDWKNWGLAWVDVCDKGLRLEGYSEGADIEEARFREQGKTVYFGLQEYLMSRKNES